jgi:hypothetical protein
MALFAILENNIVTNVVVGESLESVQAVHPTFIFVEYNEENPAFVGYVYDGLIFKNPDAVEIDNTAPEETPEDPA